MGDLNAYELAQRARERAVHNYMAECDRLTAEGAAVYDKDAEGAMAHWLDAMKALDCAKIAAVGLNLDDKESA